MPTYGQSLSNLSATNFASEAIKLVYGDLHEQLRDKNPALQLIEASSQHITQNGRSVVFDTHIGRNQGIGARGVREALPVAGAQKYKQATLDLVNLYGTIEVDGQLFEQASENYQAFINVVDNEIRGLKKDLAVDLNRQVYGDGSGKLATVSSKTGSTITFDSVQWIQEGMLLAFYDASGTARATASGTNYLTVVSINEATKVVTFAAAIPAAVVATDIAVRGSYNGGDSYGKEWTGLGKIVKATGSLHGIDPSSYPIWASHEKAQGGALTELALINLVQTVDKKGGEVDAFLASPGVFNAYWALLTSLRRFNDGGALVGGQRAFTFTAAGRDINFVSDYAAPSNTLYALSTKELVVNRKKDWAWMDRDGSMWSRSGDTDAYKAVLYQYSNLGTYRRNAHAVMTGITEA